MMNSNSERAAPGPDIATIFLRWSGLRAALHRGYWLVTSLYLVVDAGLSPSQLVFIGVAQGVVSLMFEIPTGVVADTISRKWSLVIFHILVSISMVVTGLVTAFPALVATQMLWGIAWTFASGADVAWVTDELNRPERTGAVLAAQARWQQIGAAGGMLACGALAWASGLSTAMVSAGGMMALLGLYVVTRFPERRFTPTRTRRRRQATTILRRGVILARRDREILVVFAATFLVHGGAVAFGRLYPKQLVDLGFPSRPDPIVWFTALGIVTFVAGAVALRIVEARIAGVGVARRTYAAACGTGVLGVLLLIVAPDFVIAGAGVLLVAGIAQTVTRAVGAIWVNPRHQRCAGHGAIVPRPGRVCRCDSLRHRAECPRAGDIDHRRPRGGVRVDRVCRARGGTIPRRSRVPGFGQCISTVHLPLVLRRVEGTGRTS